MLFEGGQRHFLLNDVDRYFGGGVIESLNKIFLDVGCAVGALDVGDLNGEYFGRGFDHQIKSNKIIN